MKGIQQLWRDCSGVSSVEYAVVLSLVTIGGAAAILALGAPLIIRFRVAQLLIALPIP